MKTKQLKLVLCVLVASLMTLPIMANVSRGADVGITAEPVEITVRGNVSDASGPLIGVSVKVVGTTNGTITDHDGNFILKCSAGDELEVSYIGYKTLRVKAKDNMKIKLEEDSMELGEVVVTALGIKRQRKALGYGLSEVYQLRKCR